MLSASQLSGENPDTYAAPSRPQSQSIAVQTTDEPWISSATEAPQPPDLEPEYQSIPKPEVVTYSKAVQTDGLDFQPETPEGSVASDGEESPGTTRSSKRLSRRDRERDEEIRQKLRKEIEDELQATNQVDGNENTAAQSAKLRYPLRKLDDDELKAVTSSDDFLDFVERSSKVIERALDEDYDVLADYELGGTDGHLQEDEETGKKRRGVQEVCHFWDERWSKNRIISDISFSPKASFPLTIKCALAHANLGSSSLNCCLHHTPRILQLLTNPMALFRSGISTCKLVRNMSSTRHPISLPQNSLLTIRTLLLEAPIRDRCSYGTPVPRVPVEALQYKRPPYQAADTPIPFTAFRLLAHRMHTIS